MDIATGNKEVFNAGLVGRPGALANDGAGNLLILDGAGQKLLRVDPKRMTISVVAAELPIGYLSSGSYPLVEWPLPMSVSAKGDVFLTTTGRGVVKLEKSR